MPKSSPAEIQQRNVSIFTSFKKFILKTQSLDSFLSATRYLGRLLAFNPAGVYVAPEIEMKAMVFSARMFATDLTTPVRNGKTLHILSSAFKTGGHTRVVESWIDIDPGPNDVLILNQYPAYKLLAPRSKVFDLYHLDQIGKIREMRKIAKNYEYIVLHVHPEDISPVVAFGHNFSNKVIFYNHADHVFTFGPWFADAVIDISEMSRNFSKTQRLVHRNFKLAVPISNEDLSITQGQTNLSDLRKSLNLEGKKVVLSIGAPYKFLPTPEMSLFKTIEEMQSDENVHFLLIGPGINFKKFCNSSNVTFLGLVPYAEIHHYYALADLYVDSLPIGGGVAISKALLLNIPTVSVFNGYHQFDFTLETCVAYENLTSRIRSLLTDKSIDQSKAKTLLLEHKPENWLIAKDLILKNVEKRKSYETFANESSIQLDDFTLVQISNFRNLQIPLSEIPLPFSLQKSLFSSPYIGLKEKILLPLKTNIGPRIYKFLYRVYHSRSKLNFLKIR